LNVRRGGSAVGNSKGMQKKQKPDPDLETWAKLGVVHWRQSVS
jgi:hypothetical protein